MSLRDLLGLEDLGRPVEPVDIADALHRRQRDDATWLSLTAADDSPASIALRAYVGQRQVAWATAASLIERAAGEGRYLRRQWATVDRLHALAEQSTDGGGPIYRSVACWLAEALLELEREGD